MSAPCRGCKRQVVILEGGGGAAELGTDALPRKIVMRGATGEGTRGRGPVTSPTTLSTDLGQRVARFIYMHVGEREGAFLFTRARKRANERASEHAC